MESKFLNTVWGSWLKVFVSAVLGQVMVVLASDDQTLFCMETAKNIGIVGATAVIPIIINGLNAAEPRYGKK